MKDVLTVQCWLNNLNNFNSKISKDVGQIFTQAFFFQRLKVKKVLVVQLCPTLCDPWTVAHQASLSMGFSKYWSGLRCPLPGDFPNSDIQPASLCLLHWQASSLPLTPPGKPLIRCNTNMLVAKLCPTLQCHGVQPARLLCPWNSPGKNTGVGCHFLLHGIFQSLELNPSLLHCRRMLYLNDQMKIFLPSLKLC